MAGRFASAVVRARVAVVVAWVVAAAAVTLLLPDIREAQVGSLGDLVPAGAEAIESEERAAELFAFPVLSRTVVVVRDPDGIGVIEHARILERLFRLNRGTLPALGGTRGYPVSNVLGDAPFVRERATTVLIPLLFPPGVGQSGRAGAAERFAQREVRRVVGPDAFIGVTGAVPARDAQADVIADKLPLVELATLLFVLAAVGWYFRSVLAPVVNLVAVALAYLVSIRLVAVVGEAVGVSVPSEVEPVIVALLFGVVTDYSLFFLSRFRRRLVEGEAPVAAARRTTAELLPIILACGLAVVAATSALLVADLGFLRAFGPGMGMAVLIGLAVAITFIPAMLALLGARLFWPSAPRRQGADEPAEAPRDGIAARLVRGAVRRPRRTIALCLLALAAMAAPMAWIDLGNPLIRGLPPDNDVRVAYVQATQGFVPGTLSPTVLLVEQDGIARERDNLARLQELLDAQPGVAQVIGPATNPTQRQLGAVLARTGDAARYLVILRADPLGAGAINRVESLRGQLDAFLALTGLSQAQASFAGDTALSLETIEDTVADLLRIVPAVLIAVLVVLVVFLRGLVAPLYLVAAALLAPFAAIGLTVALFEIALDRPELTYYVPVTAGVLLVALGSDYNIFLVGRVWSEARRRPLDEAIVVAGAGAARAISAAGIVLAVSFGALALVPVAPFQELAFTMAAGLVIDAFLVRTVLVPAVIALVGYRSGWPGDRLRRQGERAESAVTA